MMNRLILCFAVLWLLSAPSAAHEVRPALLDLTERQSGQFIMVWKQPLKDGKRLAITPVFGPLCQLSETEAYEFYGAAVAEIRTVNCPLTSGEIRFKGLESTLTDSYVTITYLNGETRNGLVGASDPVFNLSTENEAAAVPAYLTLGISHIFAGWDHLALVVGLLLLVPVRRIWLVITSFTLAHSITLGFAAMGVIALPGRPVEILIALSIVWLAYEAVQEKRPQKGMFTGSVLPSACCTDSGLQGFCPNWDCPPPRNLRLCCCSILALNWVKSPSSLYVWHSSGRCAKPCRQMRWSSLSAASPLPWVAWACSGLLNASAPMLSDVRPLI